MRSLYLQILTLETAQQTALAPVFMNLSSLMVLQECFALNFSRSELNKYASFISTTLHDTS
ncbi:MAG: hypothetical protein ACJAT7_002664 [Psychromonas sp.]|jgi:hypothetical protein